ncbi:MAG: GLUG motif-containing protein, partial [Phycisphaerales bacterium]
MNGQARYTNWVVFTLLTTVATACLPARAQYGGGTGEVDSPYLIETAEQMNAIGLCPEDWGEHFRLTADIDMNDLAGIAVNPIGVFQGVFDGGGHTIANWTCVVTDEEGYPEVDFITDFGLFRSIQGPNSLVKDLGLVNPDLRPASTCSKRVECVGALAGFLSGGSVRNCFVEGGHVLGDKSVGGLVGASCGTISDSWSSAEVSGDAIVGGLIGRCKRPTTVSRCYAQSRVSGETCVGGLVGTCSKQCDIDDCFATGSVTAEERTGGLVGFHEGSVSRCYSTASVSADSDAGGLAGINGGTITESWAGGEVTGGRAVGGLVGLNLREDSILFYDPIVTDSYATGPVCGEDIVGGLIGQNQGGTVLRCYSAGPVTGLAADCLAGGLVGANSDVPMWDCFWDTATSSLNSSDGGIGMTTLEMQDTWIYVAAGWDFAGETAN